MKRLILLCSVFITVSLSAQDSLYNALQKDVCNCLQNKGTLPSPLTDFRNCIRQAFVDNITLVESEVLEKFGTTATYEQGQELGRKIGERLDTSLVYTCDIYFQAADSLRYTQFNFNKDSLKKE